MSASSHQSLPWHASTDSAILQLLRTSTTGLTETAVAARLREYGANVLPQKPPPSIWMIVLRQLRSPLIYVLLLAAVISIVIGNWEDAAFIAVVLAINSAIGSYQEWQAERSGQALKSLLQILATVERDGEIRKINAEEIVPGDVVWLESGDRIPADLRLIFCNGLEVDESTLTGESAPVVKDDRWIGSETTELPDRLNMAFAGSNVVRGRAKGIAVATGANTNIGRLAADLLDASGSHAPLLIRMENFTRFIGLAVIGLSVVIGLFGITFGGYGVFDIFFLSIALVVSAIPEGLPVAISVALAGAATRMARRGVIVRQLSAVEGLGSCTLIATDKTGTLTCNELTVRTIHLSSRQDFQVTGEGFDPAGQVQSEGRAVSLEEAPVLELLALASVLCNEADLSQRDGRWISRGDAVDVALLCLGHKMGQLREELLSRYRPVHQISFESERQFAATFHQTASGNVVFVKGAPERVLRMCEQTMTPDDVQWAESEANRMAERGQRVLAFATGEFQHVSTSTDVPTLPVALRFIGLVGMIDPLRPGVLEAIQRSQQAGVNVMMVTGDHRATALTIARELGLAQHESQVITGAELLEKTPEQISETIRGIRVFARVQPHQKLQIVEAARRNGEFVAVTGDGVNDAPALRAANIGVAMGRSGTDVAREAAELVITDDNFATIVAGIEEGRIAYENIRKVIFLSVSQGLAEIILIGLSILLEFPYLPLLPVQLLWLNLVTNGIQDVALALEPGEDDTLKRPPRPPGERIFNQLMIERTIVAAIIMGLGSFILFWWLLPAGATEADVVAARNSLLLLLVLFENFHVANCRSETKSVFSVSLFKSPVLLMGTLAAFVIHVAAMFIPVTQKLLGTSPISFERGLLLGTIAFSIIPAMELHKWLWSIRHPLKGVNV